jgi:hypothetical protein
MEMKGKIWIWKIVVFKKKVENICETMRYGHGKRIKELKNY